MSSYDLSELTSLMEYSVAIFALFNNGQSEPLTDGFTTSKKLPLSDYKDILEDCKPCIQILADIDDRSCHQGYLSSRFVQTVLLVVLLHFSVPIFAVDNIVSIF